MSTSYSFLTPIISFQLFLNGSVTLYKISSYVVSMNSFLKDGKTKAEIRSNGFPVFITEIPCSLINHGVGS